jgi:hypothetical protein
MLPSGQIKVAVILNSKKSRYGLLHLIEAVTDQLFKPDAQLVLCIGPSRPDHRLTGFSADPS